MSRFFSHYLPAGGKTVKSKTPRPEPPRPTTRPARPSEGSTRHPVAPAPVPPVPTHVRAAAPAIPRSLGSALSMSTTVRTQRLFGESCLPLTMKTAKRLREQVSLHIAAIHPTWSFEDRVVVWLLPTLEHEARAFHTSGGRAMADIFQPRQLEHVDKDLVVELAERLRTASPVP